MSTTDFKIEPWELDSLGLSLSPDPNNQRVEQRGAHAEAQDDSKIAADHLWRANDPSVQAALALKFRLGVVTRITEALCVALHIEASFAQRHDVIALDCKANSPLPAALGTQRVSPEQFISQLLQPSSRDALGRLWLGPLRLRMQLASPTAITNQLVTTGCCTGPRR